MFGYGRWTKIANRKRCPEPLRHRLLLQMHDLGVLLLVALPYPIAITGCPDGQSEVRWGWRPLALRFRWPVRGICDLLYGTFLSLMISFARIYLRGCKGPLHINRGIPR